MVQLHSRKLVIRRTDHLISVRAIPIQEVRLQEFLHLGAEAEMRDDGMRVDE
jgi:hypothetical protein